MTAIAGKGVTVSNKSIGAAGDYIRNIQAGFPNGTSWKKSNITTGGFQYCDNANGIWVACGYSNGLYYSTNGKTWTQSNITSGRFLQCSYGNGLWVACAYPGGPYYSTDGKIWTRGNIASDEYEPEVYDDWWAECCLYANGIWVMANDWGSTPDVSYSYDGINWYFVDTSAGAANHLLHANGLWTMCGEGGVQYSYDGINWSFGNCPSQEYGAFCVYNNGLWIFVDLYCGIYYSEDGINWIATNISSDYTAGDIAYANGIWVATVTDWPDSYIYYSTDGKAWIPTEYTGVNRVKHEAGVWVASGNSQYYSIDGKIWTMSSSNINASATYHIANANGIWILCTANSGLCYSVTWEP